MHGNKRPQIATTVLRKSKVGGATLTDTRPCYEAIMNKTAWYWHKNRQIDQCSRQSLEIDPFLHEELIPDKGHKNVQWGKDGLFNNGVGKVGQIHAKNDTGPPSYTTHKNKLKMDLDLNLRPEIIRLLEENVGSILRGHFLLTVFF